MGKMSKGRDLTYWKVSITINSRPMDFCAREDILVKKKKE